MRTTCEGVPVVMERDGRLPLVHIWLHLLEGAVSDPPGESGLTRLAARMHLMGTRKRSREQIDAAVEDLGAELDVSTAHHRVTFSAHLLSDRLEPLLGILEEVLLEPAMREQDLARLRRETVADVVQMRDDDQSVAYRHFRDLLFDGHPYGRGTAGRVGDVEGAGIDRVLAHHGRILGRAPAVVAIAGDFDPDRLPRRLCRLVGRFTTMDGPPRDPPEPVPTRRCRIRLVDKPRRTQTQMYLGHLGLRADEPGYFPVAILNAAFGGTYTARLGEEIRQRRGWSYGIYSRMLGSRLRDAFYVWSFPAREHAVDCLELEMRMLGDLASGGLEPEEFEFARDHLHNHFLFAVETPALRVALAVRERVLGLESGFYDRYRERVLEVEPDEVRAHAARFVDTGAPSCAMLCDADEMQQRIRDRLGDGPLIDVMDWTSDV